MSIEYNIPPNIHSMVLPMQHNKFYELLTLRKPEGVKIESRTSVSKSPYFLISLPVEPNQKLDQYMILQNHITIFKNLDNLGSRLHYTAELKDTKGTPFKLRVYFSGKNRTTLSPSLKNADDEPQIVPKEMAIVFRTHAIKEVNAFLGLLKDTENSLYSNYLNMIEAIFKKITVMDEKKLDKEAVSLLEQVNHFSNFVLINSSRIEVFKERVNTIKELVAPKIIVPVKTTMEIQSPVNPNPNLNSLETCPDITTIVHNKKDKKTKSSEELITLQKDLNAFLNNQDDIKIFIKFIKVAEKIHAMNELYKLTDEEPSDLFKEILLAVDNSGLTILNYWLSQRKWIVTYSALDPAICLKEFFPLICTDENLNIAIENSSHQHIELFAEFGAKLNFKKHVKALEIHVQNAEVIEEQSGKEFDRKIDIACCLQKLLAKKRLSLLDTSEPGNLPLFFTLISRPVYCRIVIDHIEGLKDKNSVINELTKALKNYYNKNQNDLFYKYEQTLKHIRCNNKGNKANNIIRVFFDDLPAWCIEYPYINDLYKSTQEILAKIAELNCSSKIPIPRALTVAAESFIKNIATINIFEVVVEIDKIEKDYNVIIEEYEAYKIQYILKMIPKNEITFFNSNDAPDNPKSEILYDNNNNNV